MTTEKPIAIRAVLLLTLCLPILLAGCQSQPIKTQCEAPITIYQDRIVSVPERMTNQVPIPLAPEVVDTIGLNAWAQACYVRLKQANGQLNEIKGLNRE